jgi:hypothetical protein
MLIVVETRRLEDEILLTTYDGTLGFHVMLIVASSNSLFVLIQSCLDKPLGLGLVLSLNTLL